MGFVILDTSLLCFACYNEKERTQECMDFTSKVLAKI